VTKGQFRFSYFTEDFDSTVAFCREGLELPVIESWDRGPDDRGVLFGAASGIIEILTRPRGGQSSHLWDDRTPQGAFMVIEVDDVDARYKQAIERRLPIKQELKDQGWGHRSFCICDPNGITLYFFQDQGKRGTA
jgi:catechol 2,3-dioxygenase-like lactoylglutathione lyase family enzyme